MASSRRPEFDGNGEKYELFESKLLGHMRRLKIHDVILPVEEGGKPNVSAEDSADTYAELIQCLDDTSLNLVFRDAKDDAREALKILRAHYMSSEKPRVIALYTEMIALEKSPGEELTQYILRAETVKAQLVKAGETIADSLLMAMIMKGLPSEFKPFVTMSINKAPESFADFKKTLRVFEGTMKMYEQGGSDSVMSVERRGPKCYGCGQFGHIRRKCPKESKPINGYERWCDNCQNNTHNTSVCRKTWKSYANQSAAKVCEESSHNFMFTCKVSLRRDEVYPVTTDPEEDPEEEDSSINAVLVDTGATTHIIKDRSKFVQFDKSFNPEKHFIELADGNRYNNVAQGRGTAVIKLVDDKGKEQEAYLKDALYVPSFGQNIFSIDRATSQGASVEFCGDHGVLRAKDGTTFKIEKSGRLYFLNSVVHTKSSSRTLYEWHEAMGHCNLKDLNKMQECVEGMRVKNGVSNFECKTCVQGKMCDEKCSLPDERAAERLDFVHADLAGPISPVAKDGFKYVLCFTDDFSGVVAVYMLKHKSDTLKATEKYLADVAPFGNVKRLRTDGGGEFMAKEFRELMVRNRIKHETSASHSPHQNGTAERQWRSLFEMARCMLLDSGLPKVLWTYALSYAAYTRNRCYIQRLRKTPFEAFVGKKPNVSHMQGFGKKCMSYVTGAKKLDARGKEGIFVGYDKYSPAYLIYDQSTQTVRKARCVKFFSVVGDAQIDEVQIEVQNYRKPEAAQVMSKNEHALRDETPQRQEDDLKEKPAEPEPIQRTDRSSRTRTPPKWLEDYVQKVDDCQVDYCYTVGVHVPETFKQAEKCENSVQWKRAMDEEMESLVENDTFELTILPEGRKCVGGKWVYAVKQGSDENEVKYKARYVAKGFSQVENVDYKETFAPTAQMSTLRLLVQASVDQGMSMAQMDVKSAYLNAPIDTELYVKQPDGYKVYDKNGNEYVWKLRKSLYGLKQSGRNWNIMLHETLSENGYVQSATEPCLYTKMKGQMKVHVLVWVDDILVCTSDEEMLEETKQMLSNKFKMKDLGIVKKFLGIDFDKTENGNVTMSQRDYVERVLQRFEMVNCNPRSYPMSESHYKDVDESEKLEDVKPYQELVGCLIYIMTCTRPDISFSVSVLARKMSNPTERDWQAARDVLRYLKGSIDNKLVFCRSNDEPQIIGFSDSDWAGSHDRKSTSGYVFRTDNQSAFICWKTKKQSVVALSSCEAEYIAMAFATQEGLFLQKLFSVLYNKEVVIVLNVDNQGAVALSKNRMSQQRSKHIDVKYHFIRDHVDSGNLCPVHVPTVSNIADAFTKPLSGKRLATLTYC